MEVTVGGKVEMVMGGGWKWCWGKVEVRQKLRLKPCAYKTQF